MSIPIISNFQIRKLHGKKSYSIPVENNTLILVGENGSGKTTLIACLFYLLTGQWKRLSKFTFEEVSIILDGETVSLNSRDLKRFNQVEVQAELDPEVVRFARRKLLERNIKPSPIQIRRFIYDEMGSKGFASDESMTSLFDEKDSPHNLRELRALHRRLRKGIGRKVLYLPTYRRIEQELKYIFPKSDVEHVLRDTRSGRRHPDPVNYIELVEFGMRDVQQSIDRNLDLIKEQFRGQLYNLLLNYLSEIVDRNYKNADMTILEGQSFSVLSTVLNQVDSRLLSDIQKNRLLTELQRMRESEVIGIEQLVVAHFFRKLLELYQEQQKQQNRIVRFADICNRYLNGKAFVYNETGFTFDLMLDENNGASETLSLSDLSSGEKQIVSLFSHLLLSGDHQYYLLIDEPELSLSVDWQRRFLVDVLSTGVCRSLLAVTHSPFIFDNELDKTARSIDEFAFTDGELE